MLEILRSDAQEQGSLFRGVAQAAEQQDRERKECWRLGKQNCELSKELALEVRCKSPKSIQSKPT
eukprot:814770-Amphidinium_carterae.1